MGCVSSSTHVIEVPALATARCCAACFPVPSLAVQTPSNCSDYRYACVL